MAAHYLGIVIGSIILYLVIKHRLFSRLTFYNIFMAILFMAGLIITSLTTFFVLCPLMAFLGFSSVKMLLVAFSIRTGIWTVLTLKVFLPTRSSPFAG